MTTVVSLAVFELATLVLYVSLVAVQDLKLVVVDDKGPDDSTHRN
jgi:hypothetical protein